MKKPAYVKTILSSAVLALATLSCSTAVFSNEAEEHHEPCQSPIEGSWLYTVIIPGAIPIKFVGTESYATGGTYSEADQLGFTPGYLATPGHGAWKQTGENSYLLTYLNLTYSNGVGTGNGKVRQTMKLIHGGTEYVGSGDFFYYDVDGVTVVASGSFTITAKKIELEKPGT